jgi:DNA-binding NarL/FixJ family response regulator
MIRVLLAVPSSLRNALHPVLSDADDIEVATTAVDALEILLAAGALPADVVVIVIEDEAIPGIATHLLAEYPHLRVLGVTGDGQRAALYELEPRQVSLGEISPSGLLDAIRAAVGSEVPE